MIPWFPLARSDSDQDRRFMRSYCTKRSERAEGSIWAKAISPTRRFQPPARGEAPGEISKSIKTFTWLRRRPSRDLRIKMEPLDSMANLLGRSRVSWAASGSRLAQQLLRFGLSSGLSATLSFLLPIALHEAGRVPERLAVAIGFVLAYLFNFAMLRMFVFRSRNSLGTDALRYLPLNGVFRLVEYGGFLFLEGALSLGYIASMFTVLTISTVLKFFGYRRLFRRVAPCR